MEETAKRIKALNKELEKFKNILRVDEKKSRMQKLQMEMSNPDFWQDQKRSSKVIEELKDLKSDVDDCGFLIERLNEVNELILLQDSSLEEDIAKELDGIEKDIESLRLKLLFSEKFDNSNAILEVNSGAGGTEACDWAQMLFRMYFRWAEDKKFKVKVLNEVKGEEAGVKNITILIKGRRAYGLLKSEVGVHRLVRISPFDSNRRRHTSFASVDVVPEIKGEIDIQIKPEDLRIDTYRSSGAGGQHVNVTDSAVRITHFPSGLVVSCQNERSQHQNKQAAMSILKAKLYKLKEQEHQKELGQIKGGKQKIEWGSQIRSYVLHPYLLVKDHRTGSEDHNAKGVLDGRIDKFIYAYLNSQVNTESKE